MDYWLHYHIMIVIISSIPSLRRSAISQPPLQSLKRSGLSKSCIIPRNDSGYTSSEIADSIENS